jgi:trimeric autotransporter adhesin
MKHRIGCVVVGLLSLVVSLAAQTSSSSSAMAQVPPLIQFSNVAMDGNGKPLTGVVGITFSLYQEQQGGSPLWLETQNVQPDATGHYSITLGSTTSQGLPTSIFASGEAHWLGVQVQGQEEQPRVLLVSAPYALKAGDAATIGGLPPSAFVLAPPTNGSGGNGASASNGTILIPAAEAGSLISPKSLPAGTANYIPVWTSPKTAGNSVVYQANGKSIGVGTTTPCATLDVNGNINAGTAYDLGGTVFAFGSYANANANAFIGFAGNSSSTGKYNLASGSYALSSNTSGSLNTASGSYSLFTNTTGQYNTGNGNGTLYSNTDGAENTASGVAALYFKTLGDQNTATGVYALYANTTGGQNTASGVYALYSNITGSYNLANGYQALYSNTTGSENLADGYQALYSNTTGKGNNASGFQAL